MERNTRLKGFRQFVEDAGAPANAAGNAGVAGLGQPPGSDFGAHPQQASALGGATTKTKKKNKKAHLTEGLYLWCCRNIKCQKMWGPADARKAPAKCPACGTPKPAFVDESEVDEFYYGVEESVSDWLPSTENLTDRDARGIIANGRAALSVYPDRLLGRLRSLLADVEHDGRIDLKAVVRLRAFLRSNGALESKQEPIIDVMEIADHELERAAKEVHNRWVENQKAAGETEHKSPDGKEDYMVPYHKLSDESKEMDREAVRATLDALGLDEARETFAGAPVFEVDTDQWMNARFGKNRYHQYKRYVGEDEQGEEIRELGKKRQTDVILKDQTTGAMTYFLRRKKK